jgi:hypothetical protein
MAEDVQAGTQSDDCLAECGAAFATVQNSKRRAVGDEDVNRGSLGISE